MRNRHFVRIISFVLTLSMLMPTFAMAYYPDEPTGQTITMQDGSTLNVDDDSWEEAYPLGAFALSTESVMLKEGEEQTITIYRLGGTAGKAVAYMAYEPLAFLEDDGITPNYSMTISDDDIEIYVENDQPIAAYQQIGGEDYNYPKSTDFTVSQSDPVEVEEQDDSGEIVYVNEVTLSSDYEIEFDTIQWYAMGEDNLDFSIIDGATEGTLVVEDVNLEDYDFRYEYTIGDTTYVSTSLNGVIYKELYEEGLEIPDDVPLVAEQEFLPLGMNEEDEYSGYMFVMTFADGEYMKEIKLSTLDDDIAEALESASLYIAESDGAEIVTSLQKLIVSIEDNEPVESSVISIDETNIVVDKSEGVAKIPVVRTGGTQNALTVEYKTVDGTALAGTDYAETSGGLLFYAGIDSLYIEVDLINDGIESYDYVDFNVEIFNLLGDGEAPSEIGNDVATVSLYNTATATEQNLATMLYDSTVQDVSKAVLENNSSAASVGETVVTGTQKDLSGASAMASPVQMTSTSFALNRDNFGSLTTWNTWVNHYEWRTVGRSASASGDDWSYTISQSGTDNIQIKMYGDYGFRNDTENSTISILNDSELYKYFDYFRVYADFVNGHHERTAALDTVTVPYYNVYSYYGSRVGYFQGNEETDRDLLVTTGKGMSTSLDYGSNNITSMTAGQFSIRSSKGLEDDYSSISMWYDMIRRRFTNTMNFHIVTANDADTAVEGATVFSSDSYANIIPSIGIDGGFASNVNNTGYNMFAGSTITAYTNALSPQLQVVGIVTDSSATTSMDTWTESSGSTTINTANYIDTQAEIDAQYEHYYVLNRVQNVSVDLGPSTERNYDDDGNMLDTVNTAKYNETYDKAFGTSGRVTVKFGVQNLQSGYQNAFNPSTSYFDENPFDDKISEVALSKDVWTGGVVTDNSLNNLQYIFFKSTEPEDMMVINGVSYVSGESGVYIWLDESMLNSLNLSMSYWAVEYQAVPTTMKATIDSAYLYIDYSGDGQINGSYDLVSNQFVLASDTSDELIMYIDPYTDYDESVFAKEAVYDASGNFVRYAEKFIITKYAMNPRAVSVPEGEDENDKTQVLVSFVSDATSQNPLYSSLTDEQKSYRYITSGLMDGEYTSDNLERYGAAASQTHILITPCGGDESPVTRVNGEYVWTPKFEGNLLYTFEDPGAITIPNSLAGENIKLAIGTLEDGEITYTDDELSNLLGYLGSYVYIDTFALTVRAQEQTTGEILAEQYPDVYTLEVTTDDVLEDAVTASADSTVIFSGGVRENSDYLQSMSGADVGEMGVDTKDRNSGSASTLDDDEDVDMLEMDMGMELPSMDIELGDWVTIIMDGQSVGFAVGFPIVEYDSNGGDTNDGGTNTIDDLNTDLAKNVYNFLSSKGTDTGDDSYKKATNDHEFNAYGFSVSFSVQFAFMFAYNNLTGSYEFDTFSAAVTVEFEFRAQHRFEFFPLAYVYFQFNAAIEIGVGLGVDYIEKSLGYIIAPTYEGEETSYTYGNTITKGDTITFSTEVDSSNERADYRAFNITFTGELYLDYSDDTGLEDRKGAIQSDGSEPVLIVLTKDSEEYITTNIKLTASSDKTTSISKIDPVSSPKSQVYFSGVEISPELTLEVGLGIGIEILKAEIFANIGLSATFILGDYYRNEITLEPEYEAASVDSFAFRIALGLRVVLLILSQEFDLIEYNIEYNADDVIEGFNNGWSFYGSALGGLIELDENSEKSYVKSSLISNVSNRQNVYTPFNDEITALAYQPTDNTNVPFEYSGYSGSGDAFKLVDGTDTGYEYQVVTTSDNRNFVVYTLADETANYATETTMIVMSELLVTNNSGKDVYGLVHPNDYTNVTVNDKYVVIDTDKAGDLGFTAWADGTDIHVAWVSYTEDAIDTEKTLKDATEIAYATAKQTVVKTATFDTTETDVETAFATPNEVSDVYNVGADTAVSLPIGSSDIVAFTSADHYIDDELDDLKVSHNTHTAKLYNGYVDSTDFYDSSREMSLYTYQNMWNVLGKTSNLNVVVDGNTHTLPMTEGQVITDMKMIEAYDDTYYFAYTTQQYTYDGNSDLLTTTRLYLHSFVVDGENTGFVGDAKLIRTVIDSALDDDLDGVYASSVLSTGYENAYISSIQFLNGKIGDKLTEGEVATMNEVEAEDFLLFEMNGAVYIILSDDMDKIVAGNGTNALLYPFFKMEEVEGTSSYPTGRTNVTIGADSDGNVAAVYTSTVTGSLNNALYITAFDSQTSTWGDGTILAMRGLQIHEDSLTEDWTAEQLKYAYLYADKDEYSMLDGYTNEYGTLSQFTFSNVQIAMASNTIRDDGVSLLSDDVDLIDYIGEDTLKRFGYNLDGAIAMDDSFYEEISLLADSLKVDGDGLLILTQGSMVELLETTYEADKSSISDNRVSVYPDYNSDETYTGFYVINFGFGAGAIGEESLNFSYENFTSGNVLMPYLSFRNTGDTALRASVSNPLTVDLILSTSGGETDTVIASWEVTENVKSGAYVSLSGFATALTKDLSEGDTFYFKVYEDKDYIESSGGTAFSADTKDSKTGNFVIEDKAELAIENFELTPQYIDEDGNTVAYVSFNVTNRGTKAADDLNAIFYYESGRDENGDATYSPFDLTGHDLTVTAAYDLEDEVSLLSTENEKNGILVLSEVSEDGESLIGANQYRAVSGTIIVQPEYFASLSGDFNLTVEVISDQTVSVQALGNETSVSGHDEYDELNNSDSKTFSYMTTFTAASRIVMAMGNTTRLAVSAVSSTGAEPVLVAQEALESVDATAKLGICYYDASTGTIVIVPSKMGTGKINLTDTTTNQTYAIDFTVTDQSEGINIFNDNAIFSFYNSDDVLYSTATSTGYVGWSFVEGAWDYYTTPVNGDYSRANAGSYFEFTSVAESITLKFNGTISVVSTYDGTVRYYDSSVDGEEVTIDFANTGGATHVITVTATSNDTRFDTVIEDFGENDAPTPSEDKTAPQIYWSRSFPDTASIEAGTEIIYLTAYVLDDTGLASITVNGVSAENITKNDDGFWEINLEISGNGSYTVTAIDTGGTISTQNFVVDWFADTVSENAGASTAPSVDAKLYNDGQVVASGTFLDDDDAPYILVESNVAEATDGTISTTVNSHTAQVIDGTSTWYIGGVGESSVSDQYDISYNGYYEVYVQTQIGTWARTFVKVSAIDTEKPTIAVSFDERTESITFSATKASNGTDASTLDEITVNDYSIESGINTYIYTNSFKIEYDGAYVFNVSDFAENSGTSNVSIKEKFPVTTTEDLITDVDHAWSASFDNGSIVINESAVSGGEYNPLASTPENNEYYATYQYIVIPLEDDYDDTQVVAMASDSYSAWIAKQSWTNFSVETLVSGLSAGTHVVYIKSEIGDLDPSRQEVTILDESISITDITSTVCTRYEGDGTVTVTATGGKDNLGMYQFAIEPATEILLEPSEFTTWVYYDGDTATLENLDDGDYQVAVRIAEGITNDDAYSLAKDTLEYYENLVSGYSTQSSYVSAKVKAAQYLYAVWEKSQEESDESAYQEYVGNDTTEDLYSADYTTRHTAITTYFTDIFEAYEQAKVDFENAKIDIANAVDLAYREDPNLWENAIAGGEITVELYIKPTSPLTVYVPSNATVTVTVEDDTATIIIPEDEAELVDADIEAILEANEDYIVVLVSDEVNITIPQGMLSDTDEILGLIADTSNLSGGNTLMITDLEGSDKPVILSAIIDGVLYYAVSEIGEYYLIYDSVYFEDVASSYWGKEAIDFVAIRGLFAGVGNDMFAPEATMTRAMFVTVLGRLAGVNADEYTSEVFDDVDINSWYGPYVSWASENKIVNGYSDSEFGPNDIVTREQMCVMLAKYIDVMDIELEIYDVEQFTDEDECSSWAKDYVEIISSYGLIVGTGEGAFEPQGDATRAAVATIFMRFIKSILTF